MDREKMARILARTLADKCMSRGEKQAFGAVLTDEKLTPADLDWLRARAFSLARQEISGNSNQALVDWVEEVVKVVAGANAPPTPVGRTAAYFSPHDNIPARITELFEAARRTVDICVFTITDDRVARAIMAAHQRGLAIRIITDDEKAGDLGSDIGQLSKVGIPLRTDRSEAHMHHKFAIFDQHLLLTGSYNWTRSAATRNDENVLVTDDARLATPFAGTFARLWEKFG